MMTLKKDKQDVGSGDKEGKNRSISLFNLLTRAYLIAAVVLFCISMFAFVTLSHTAQEAQQENDRADLNRLAGHVDTWVSRYVHVVDVVAQDPGIVSILMSGDASAALTRQRELAAAMGARRVLLIVEGSAPQRLGQYPQLSYAELDMLLQAQTGRAPLVESHQPGKDLHHFDVVRAVTSKDQIVGYILVSFDHSELLHELNSVVIPGGRLELHQHIDGGRDVQLIGLGEGVNNLQRLPLTSGVNSTRWQLMYWPSEKYWQVFGADWRITFWLTIAEVLAVVALLLAIFRRHIERVILQDAALFYSFMRDRVSGQWMGKDYTPALKEFIPALEKLKSMNLAGNTHRRVPRRKNLAKHGDVDESMLDDPVALAQEKEQFDQSYVNLIYQNRDAELLEAADVDDGYQPRPKSDPSTEVERSIFRAYDIRGVVDETLTADHAYQIGRAIGSEAWVRGEQSVIVARDGRLSGPKLGEALIKGLRDSGRDVIDIGRVPTPILYFATHYLSSRSGVMVTGSHNPARYNGFKVVLKGETLSESAIRALYDRIINDDFTMGEGTLTSQDITSDYIARVVADAKPKRSLKIVVDCGNGVAGSVAPTLLRAIGCDVTELYCEVDGHFPNHHPDPSQPDNLLDLIAEVKNSDADLGLAFDGDGDRLGVVDAGGNIIWPDRQMMLYAKDVLKNNPGAQVIYDVKCSSHLQHEIESHGGCGMMWKSGHSLIKHKMAETGALLAGEMSGHIFFADRWYGFDDALYTSARLLEIISQFEERSSTIFKTLPGGVSTPELMLNLPEGANFEYMDRLVQSADFAGADLINIDGIRAEYEGGWGLVRASNTTPSLVFRFEAENSDLLSRIQAVFRDELMHLDSTLKLPF